jgi:YidC/Oxa1 family membrane protein insertase
LSILNPINDLVAWVIMHIYAVLTPVFGATSGVTWVLSIVFLVVAMRLLMLPLFIKQMHTQRAMTALTPRISELRKKYKGDKEKLNAETMKLYQEAGVNPLMGCLPVVLQMPLFFALFSVLRAIATPKQALPYGLTTSFVHNAAKAQIFGASIKDKVLFTGTTLERVHGHLVKVPLYVPLHAKIVILVVVLISMATTYLTMRQSQKRGMMPTGKDSPMGQSQQIMIYVMPLFALTGLYWPFGLVLYWVTTNLWTLGQQYVLLRRYPVGAAAMGPGGNVPIGTKPVPAAGLVAGTARKPGAAGKPSASGKPGPSARPGTSAKPGSSTRPGASAGKPGSDGKPGADGRPAGSGKQSIPAGDAGNASGSVADAAGDVPRVADAVPGSVPADGVASSANGTGSSAAKKPGSAKDGKASRSATAGRVSGAGAAAGGSKGARSSSPPGAAKPGAGTRSGPGVTRSGPGAPETANGHKAESSEGGLMRRFGRARTAPEPSVPAEPEAKIVRQQRQRQSRSKRSGKR